MSIWIVECSYCSSRDCTIFMNYISTLISSKRQLIDHVEITGQEFDKFDIPIPIYIFVLLTQTSVMTQS